MHRPWSTDGYYIVFSSFGSLHSRIFPSRLFTLLRVVIEPLCEIYRIVDVRFVACEPAFDLARLFFHLVFARTRRASETPTKREEEVSRASPSRSRLPTALMSTSSASPILRGKHERTAFLARLLRQITPSGKVF